MPRHCCVPGCNSNYDSNAISTFSFPKEKTYRKMWMKAIPRKNWEPTKYSSVCILHFHANQILKEICGRRLKYPRLVEYAVPSIFPNFPQCFSVPEPTHRQNPSIRSEKVVKRIEELPGKILKADIIKNYTDFLTNFEHELNLDGWYISKNSNSVIFFRIEPQEELICKFTVRIVVNSGLCLRVCVADTEVPSENLSWILPRNSKLTLWSQILNILAHYKETGENSLAHNTETADFHEIFESDYLKNCEVDPSANMCVYGYASHSIANKLSCTACKNLIVNSEVENCSNYFKSLQRGGLSGSTQSVIILGNHMYAIFEEICRNKDLYLKYFKKKNQRGILAKLTIQSCLSDNFYVNFDYVCKCGSSSYDIYSKICLTLANIILNDYAKHKNDKIMPFSSRELQNFEKV